MSMPSNIEIKARLDNWEVTWAKVEALAETECEIIKQEDIFFHVPNGRLKLRLFENGSADLIQYHRNDTRKAKQSTYTIFKTTQPDNLQQALTDALGVRVIVRKTRFLFLTGQTRIHLDRVDNLGEFLELEVVLQSDQSISDGQTIANHIMAKLDIKTDQLIDVAYADLLLSKNT